MDKQPKFEVTLNGGNLIVTGDYSPEQQQTYFDPYWPAAFDIETCHTASGSDVLFLLSKEQIKEIENEVLAKIHEQEKDCE